MTFKQTTMYFIDHIQTYKAVNRKGDELQNTSCALNTAS